MTHIDALLNRAQLIRRPRVPRDTVPPTRHPQTRTPPTTRRPDPTAAAAAANLRTLCTALTTHSPPADFTDFLTEHVPHPRSALLLACLLHPDDSDTGARFWWQYAAGAGHPTAAYCLHLHHAALGEHDTAAWWHTQAGEIPQPNPRPHPPGNATYHAPADADPATTQTWDTHAHRNASTSTSTLLRVLRHLAGTGTRPLPAEVSALQDYVTQAVSIGYLWRPDTDLPTPQPGFARHLTQLLAERPDVGPDPGREHTTPRPQPGPTRTPGPLPRRVPARGCSGPLPTTAAEPAAPAGRDRPDLMDRAPRRSG